MNGSPLLSAISPLLPLALFLVAASVMPPTPPSATSTPPHGAEPMCCPVVELRQYTMKPGRRDDLIALFDEHFIEGQEGYGIHVIGQFRHARDPNQFVWLRGFADMEARRQALEGFYGGPIWAMHRTAANDTMADSDNVLLLRPTGPTSGFHLRPGDRPARDAGTPDTTPSSRANARQQGGIILTTIYSLNTSSPRDPATSGPHEKASSTLPTSSASVASSTSLADVQQQFARFFDTRLTPSLRAAGATVVATFVTEPAPNTFPRLPVRDGESVFVWIASFADDQALAAFHAALQRDPEWATSQHTLQRWLSKPADVLELTPTRRSLLRHR